MWLLYVFSQCQVIILQREALISALSALSLLEASTLIIKLNAYNDLLLGAKAPVLLE